MRRSCPAIDRADQCRSRAHADLWNPQQGGVFAGLTTGGSTTPSDGTPAALTTNELVPPRWGECGRCRNLQLDGVVAVSCSGRSTRRCSLSEECVVAPGRMQARRPGDRRGPRRSAMMRAPRSGPRSVSSTTDGRGPANRYGGQNTSMRRSSSRRAGLDPAVMTLPSGISSATEWYSRAPARPRHPPAVRVRVVDLGVWRRRGGGPPPCPSRRRRARSGRAAGSRTGASGRGASPGRARRPGCGSVRSAIAEVAVVPLRRGCPAATTDDHDALVLRGRQQDAGGLVAQAGLGQPITWRTVVATGSQIPGRWPLFAPYCPPL